VLLLVRVPLRVSTLENEIDARQIDRSTCRLILDEITGGSLQNDRENALS